MKSTFWRIPALVFALLWVWPVVAPAQSATVVRGQATFPEAIAVPAGAELEVVVQDVSRADAAAVTLGRTTLTGIGQPPYAFEVPYDPRQVVERYTYSVRARITHEGRLLFTTDRFYPVLTRGGDNEVQLELKPVGALRTQRPPGADRDANGCIGSAGYVWCAREATCVRPWELAAERSFPNRPDALKAYCSGTR